MRINSYKSLPWSSLTDDRARARFGSNRWAVATIDILDGDLWSSRISLIGNMVIIAGILLSTAAYILTNGNESTSGNELVVIVEHTTSTLLALELLLRARFAAYLGYEKYRIPTMGYLFSFIGLIDLLSLLPYLFSIAGFSLSGSLVAIRILRLWRITRYIPSFRGVSDAFKSRRDEILVTLLAVILLSLTLSAVMFHAEKGEGSDTFTSITDVFVWSMGKYTGDYGDIAGAAPVTSLGKLIATFNGLLGIALFAIPAGLLASAFIDQLGDQRKSKEIKERYSNIQNYFDRSVGGGKHFRYKANWRYASFDTLQAKFVYSDEQVFEAIRESPRLRFRAMKSSSDVRFNDIRIVECFHLNCSYGYRHIRPDSAVTLVNPVGEVERGISHFAYTLGNSLPISLVSREISLYQGTAKIGSNKSMFFSKYIAEGPLRFSLPFSEFMKDIEKASPEGIVVIISSAASGRNDVVLEYGNSIGDTSWNSSTTTFSNEERFNQTRSIIHETLQNVLYRTQSEKNIERSFTIEESTIGLNSEDSLLRATKKITGSDVIAIHANVSLLIGDDEHYFALLTAFGDIIDKINRLYS